MRLSGRSLSLPDPSVGPPACTKATPVRSSASSAASCARTWLAAARPGAGIQAKQKLL